MRNFLFTLLLLIQYDVIISQVPLFDFAHSYGSEFDSGIFDGITSVSYIDGNIVVSGSLITQASLGLNQPEFLSSPAIRNGVSIWYDENLNLNEYFVLGRRIASTQLTVNNLKVFSGEFYYSEDFDLSGNSPLQVDTISNSSNIFHCSYQSNNELNWLRYGSLSYDNVCQSVENRMLLAHYFSGFKLAGLNDTLSLANGQGENEGIAFIIDNSGSVQSFKTFVSEGNDILKGCDYSQSLLEYTIVGRSVGLMDYQWEDTSPYVIDHDGPAAFAASYNDQLHLTSLLIITNQEVDQSDQCEFISCKYDADGNQYITGLVEQGEYTLKLNDYEEDFLVINPIELVVVKINSEKQLVWINRMEVDDFCYFNNLDIDHNGFVNACGYFDTFIDFTNTSTALSGTSESGFIARWTPEGELVWANTICEGGLNSVNDICITPQNEMYIGGWFTSYSTDFDFSSEGTYDLGLTHGDDAFLAKYTISDPTPDVFIEEGWQTTEVTEGGATDNIYIRLSHAPSSSVQVTATPDAQLDLGNGQGVPVTFSFEANSTAVHQQLLSVAAFDDTAVENLHTGVITFNVTSSDSDFDGLIEQPITVNITDNDVISVQETSAIEFSISPNPATEDLQINFSIYQNNTPLQIFDESGKLVKKLSISGSQHRINISDLAAGTYTIVIQNEKDKYSQVFIKK